MEIYTENARAVHFWSEEQVLDKVWVSMSKANHTCQKPAVTERALVKRLVLEAASAPKRIARRERQYVLSAGPGVCACNSL